MGRSRAIPHSAEEDHNQSRSKRKRNASNVENLEPATADQEIAEGKKALYHCNYCNKDISGMIRIKCIMCPDFDLCVECFSVGAELNPHKSNHPYRVMDNLSFPLICSDWNADEEILLLEGIEMYGLGNWTEVAEHVGTKSKAQCIDHYNAIYMNSPCFPLPDMSHVMGKNREELLAMAKEHGEVNKGFPTLGELTVNDELLLSARIKVEDQRKEGSTGQSSSSLTSETGAGVVAGNTSTSAVKRASQIKDDHQDIKMEDSHADRSIGEKKLRTPGEEGPSMTRLSGYNPKRREFELEYDHDAEQLLADMEFKESDTDAERELKLRVLRIYLKRLDERKRRKDFVLERNLLYPDPFEKNLSPEEREICRRYRVFMRFHSKEVHEELLTSIIEEHRIMKIIQDLQEARAAGCRTSAQAEKYIEEKRKKEAEESACKSKDSAQAGPSGKFLQRAIHLKGEPDSSPRGNARGLSLSDSFGKDSSSTTPGQATSSSLLDSWDVNGFLGADLLSESEKWLCSEIRILPSHYLSMLQTMSVGILNGNITTKSDAHGLFKAVDPSKVDRVYDMLVKKGIGSS
ncbi:transcriptional adapter ADA2-like isoform X1 [Camellia sinensis]|uniref:transcriptional adapter ADA2-like isoform X1 n=1 Tax=Camellia sinensis TaxID=4442 RepID=UPI001036A486|nr:transcriptional adapter ADA2-like isoform X1 [Camellia sinensis]XP_028115816.1 transcriptional adapter ADA2-like isoform X1 [Camellia sinensis]